MFSLLPCIRNKKGNKRGKQKRWGKVINDILEKKEEKIYTGDKKSEGRQVKRKGNKKKEKERQSQIYTVIKENRNEMTENVSERLKGDRVKKRWREKKRVRSSAEKVRDEMTESWRSGRRLNTIEGRITGWKNKTGWGWEDKGTEERAEPQQVQVGCELIC